MVASGDGTRLGDALCRASLNLGGSRNATERWDVLLRRKLYSIEHTTLSIDYLLNFIGMIFTKDFRIISAC